MSTEKEHFKEMLEVVQSQGVKLLEFYAFLKHKGLGDEFLEYRALQRKEMAKLDEAK
ncbi:hypothetical protein HUC00_28685 [Bacillus mycoides]|jgi:hypothetical protein|nr:hypothetical protein [Bacillus mycoides]